MIRIHRPPGAPEVLLTEGAARRRAHEMEVDADPGSFVSGTSTLTFDRDVYAHQSVKVALVAMQHEKCAFCEAKPLHVSDGDVEHFRPKGGVRQADTEPLERPGYYWLAYEWDNLLFACERCNRRHKKSLFPLTDPSRRARSHRDASVHEAPIFVDPAAEDPEPYIGYRDHVPIAIGGNLRGEQTIEALGLRRPDLNADRERHLAFVKMLHAVVSNPEVPDDLQTQARHLLTKAVAGDAEYSLMCRVAVGALGELARTY
jgi:uncharacterized protein (TIGR02646 family)